MIVVFQGMESPDHFHTMRTVADMVDGRVRIVAGVSYKSLIARKSGVKYLRTVSAQFPIVLEAGVSQADMDRDQAQEFMDGYYAFATGLGDEIDYFLQFDNSAIGPHEAPDDPRMVPILFDPTKPDQLVEILDSSTDVAMRYTGDKRVPTILRKYETQGGLYLAIMQSDLMVAKKAGFNAVSTQSWVGPGKYGEISIWDGSKFHRSSKDDKERLLTRYKPAVEKAGFDFPLLQSGDAKECNRLAAYSLLMWSASLMAEQSDISGDADEEELVSEESTSAISVFEPVKTNGRKPLYPVVYEESMEVLEEKPDGSTAIVERGLLRASADTVRTCDTCYLATTCPAAESGSKCKFNFPAQIRTDAQVKALMHTMVEVQASRVMFARFAEEVNGGYPDPVVGQEMDRLMRLTDRVKKNEERRERLTVSVEAESSNGGAGVLSRIFGGKAAIPQAPPTTIVAEVMDANVSDE